MAKARTVVRRGCQRGTLHSLVLPDVKTACAMDPACGGRHGGR